MWENKLFKQWAKVGAATVSNLWEIQNLNKNKKFKKPQIIEYNGS